MGVGMRVQWISLQPQIGSALPRIQQKDTNTHLLYVGTMQMTGRTVLKAMPWILPKYAKNSTHVCEREIVDSCVY